MPSLQSILNDLVGELVRDVLLALRQASVHELGEPTPRTSAFPRPPRETPTPKARGSYRRVRSAAEIQALTSRLIERVAQHPNGIAAGPLRTHLGLDANAFIRPLREARASGRIVLQGTRSQGVYLPAPAATTARKASPLRPRKAPRIAAIPAITEEEPAAREETFEDSTAATSGEPSTDQITDPQSLLESREASVLGSDSTPSIEPPEPSADVPLVPTTPMLRPGESLLRTAQGSAVLRRHREDG